MNLVCPRSAWSSDKGPVFPSPLSNEQSYSVLEFVSSFAVWIGKYTDLANRICVVLKMFG